MDVREDPIPVPRSARLPIELAPPPGFRPDDVATWPKVVGRLEYVRGRLMYMPPCGDLQQDVCYSVAALLMGWVKTHREFVAGGNEAGMVLGGDVRAADGAVWRRDQVGGHTGGYRRVPPVLAVEVAGREEQEADLREKAAWYLGHGVKVVWLVLPDTREVVVVAAEGERRHGRGDTLPPNPALPGLVAPVAELFDQLDPT
jgi:Uma2 family endonuclease